MKDKVNREINIRNLSIVKTLVLIMSIGTLFLSVLSIAGHGYIPPDDASRHVAKVISGKDWKDILVVREDFTMDSHPGWHWILNAFYRLSGTDNDGLLVFSIAFMFLLFTIPPLFLYRHQEAWILSILIFAVFNFGLLWRLLLGRPYIFTMSVMMIYLFLWYLVKEKQRPVFEIIGIALLIALSTWIHCSWHLFMLPLIAFTIAREWRSLKLFGIATFVGVLIGSLLTGSPVQLFYQTTVHLWEATTSYEFKRQLVSEFQPFAGDSNSVLIVTLFLLWRKVRGDWDKKVVDNPIFILIVIGWIGGYVANRFWSDWGWVSLVFWIAKELDSVFCQYEDYFLSFKRLVISATLCLALFFAITNDRDSRWSISATIPKNVPSIDNPEHKDALPQKGGIVYSNNMGVFYRIFFQNPHADFRYILGFEPIWMPKEDLKIYRKIQLDGSSENYQPWVKKMRPEDRIILLSSSKPEIEGLEWTKIVGQYWSGKKKDAK